MMFLDRTDAADRLARELKEQDIDFDIVLALPRGGVILGAIISDEFNRPLDLVIPRKIGAPMNPEFAIGAVTESGVAFVHPEMKAVLDGEWIDAEIKRERDEAVRRRETYLRGRDHMEIAGKKVLIVDDGIATGYTMRAAIEEVKMRGAKVIIVAAPVGSPDTVEKLRGDVDRIVVLHLPEDFQAVGEFYKYFDQVSDEEVIRLMEGREKLL